MKALATLALLMLLAIPGQAQITGPVLTSGDAGFSITLPAGATVPEPRELKDPHTGQTKLTRWQVDSGPRMYVVSCIPVKGDGSKLLSTLHPRGDALGKPETAPFKGYPCLTVRHRAETAGHIVFDRITMVVAGSRLYTIEFSTPDRDDLEKPETRAFFDSFQVLK